MMNAFKKYLFESLLFALFFVSIVALSSLFVRIRFLPILWVTGIVAFIYFFSLRLFVASVRRRYDPKGGSASLHPDSKNAQNHGSQL